MEQKPKQSGQNPKQQQYQRKSTTQESSQNSNKQNMNKKNHNNNQSSNYSRGKNSFKTFEYVRKVDTLEEQQEQLNQKRIQEEQEELQRQEQIKIEQEQQEKLRQLELALKLEQERLEQEEQLRAFIQEVIISSILINTENLIQKRQYLKSREGLSYLFETNFADFEEAVTTNIPEEVVAFSERVYVAHENNNNFRKRHFTQNSQYNNNQDYQQSSPQNQNNQQPKTQRMTVRQRLSNAQNINQNMRHQNNRSKNLTQIQDSRVADLDDDSKWRQSRAPLFSQSKDELKFLLNVLTPDNFENLKEQFFQLCQNDIEKCIHSLINKVCNEAKYTKLYASLSVYVKDREEEVEKENKLNNNQTETNKSFKSSMFQILQEFFYDQKKLNSILIGGQQNKNNEEDDEELLKNSDGSSNSHQEVREKKRFQIFLKFLGELFLSKFMPKKIISYCIQTMMQQYIQKGLKAEDKNLEGIIALLDSIGQDFENSWKNSPSRQIYTDLAFLQQLYNQFNSKQDSLLKLDLNLFENQFISFDGVMKILVYLNSTDKISIRIKSLITNLIYRKDNNWQKALHQKEDPRTLQELHRQHYDELNRRQQEVEEHYSNQKRSPIKLSKSNSSSIRNQSIDYSKEVKKVFTDLDNNNYDIEESIELLNKLGINNILQHLFSTFFDARLENLQQRHLLMNQILRETSFQKPIFLTALNNSMNLLYSQACDFPHLNDSFINVLCPLILAGYLDLDALKQYPCNDPDEDEDKNYFFQQIKQDCTAYLKSVNYFMCDD